MNTSTFNSVVINDVVADLNSETLLGGNGRKVALRRQTFAVLRHLIEHPNRLVTKVELLQAVWGDTAVTEDSLVQCIHEIRRAIEDDGHVVLQTVSRRGYRLVLPTTHPLPASSKPSIAVLPFANISDDPGQDYFADGLVEDLITDLSKIPGLFVIARNSSFAYRGKTVDIRTIAGELGVRYLLEGSVRRSGNRLRINGQLVEGASGAHVWAGRFDGSAEDVFDFQDQLTEQIVGAVEPSIRHAEIERARRKRPDNLDAYDLFLRALPHCYANTPPETEEALRLLLASLHLDPGYVSAHAYAAWCYEQRYLRGGFDPQDRQAVLDHADVALGINSDDPQAMSIAAFVRANITRDHGTAIEVLDRALAMNENSALALGFSALVSAHSERLDRAVEHAQRALRLSPLDDPLNYHPYCALAIAHLFAGRFTEAIKYSNLAIRANPSFSVPHAYLVAGQIGIGNLEAANIAAGHLLQVAPSFSVDSLVPIFRPSLMQGIAKALRKAGLPQSRD